jgi:hypothetical protein
MTTNLATTFSGFLFWLIIVTNIASNRFGYQTFGDLRSEADLQRINNNPGEFRTGFVLILIEHICIILLAVMLFIAFGQYNLILGIAWLICRGGEGLIQIINKRDYWRLLNVARQFTDANDAERNALADARLRILKSKYSNFIFAQILFSLGTLAYSIQFVIYGVVPAIIGWFGVVAALLYGLGNGITMLRPGFKVLWSLGGLFILIFEVVLGGWLMFLYPSG